MNYNLNDETLKEIFDFYFESHGQKVEEVQFLENRVLVRTKSKVNKRIDIPEFIHKRPHRTKYAKVKALLAVK